MALVGRPITQLVPVAHGRWLGVQPFHNPRSPDGQLDRVCRLDPAGDAMEWERFFSGRTSVSGNGRWAAVAEVGHIRRYELTGIAPIELVGDVSGAFAVTDDGQEVAAEMYASIWRWRRSGGPPHGMSDCPWPVCQLAYSADGRLLVVATTAQQVLVGRRKNRFRLDPIELDWLHSGQCIARPSPDGWLVAVTQHEGGLWRRADRTTVRLGGFTGRATALAFSPDSSRLFAGCEDNAVRLWDTRTGGLMGEWDFGIGPVTAVAVAPDGLTAAAGGSRGRVVVWDLDD